MNQGTAISSKSQGHRSRSNVYVDESVKYIFDSIFPTDFIFGINSSQIAFLHTLTYVYRHHSHIQLTEKCLNNENGSNSLWIWNQGKGNFFFYLLDDQIFGAISIRPHMWYNCTITLVAYKGQGDVDFDALSKVTHLGITLFFFFLIFIHVYSYLHTLL